MSWCHSKDDVPSPRATLSEKLNFHSFNTCILVVPWRYAWDRLIKMTAEMNWNDQRGCEKKNGQDWKDWRKMRKIEGTPGNTLKSCRGLCGTIGHRSHCAVKAGNRGKNSKWHTFGRHCDSSGGSQPMRGTSTQPKANVCRKAKDLSESDCFSIFLQIFQQVYSRCVMMCSLFRLSRIWGEWSHSILVRCPWFRSTCRWHVRRIFSILLFDTHAGRFEFLIGELWTATRCFSRPIITPYHTIPDAFNMQK